MDSGKVLQEHCQKMSNLSNKKGAFTPLFEYLDYLTLSFITDESA